MAGAPCAHRTLERLGHAGRDRRRQAGQGRSWVTVAKSRAVAAASAARSEWVRRVPRRLLGTARSGGSRREGRLSGGRGVSRTRHSWRVRAALPRRGGPEVDRRAHGQAHRNGSAGARGGDSGRIGRGAAVGSAAVAPRRWREHGPGGARRSGAGMGLAVDLLEPLLADVGVDLRGRHVGVAQGGLLDDPEVGTPVEQVRGVAVPQCVRVRRRDRSRPGRDSAGRPTASAVAAAG